MSDPLIPPALMQPGEFDKLPAADPITDAPEPAKKLGRPALPPEELAANQKAQREKWNEQRRLNRTGEAMADGKEPSPAAVNIDTIADDIADELPEPEDFDTPEPDKSEAPPNADTPKDISGTPFNPRKHKSDSDGKPLKDSTGHFVRKWARQPSGQDEFQAFAELVSQMQYQIFGALHDMEEAQPSPEIHEKLVNAWAVYARTKNLSIASPGWGLVAAEAVYIAHVSGKPKTKEKMLSRAQKAIGWIKGRFGKKK